ncbi:MAG: hypothetical protein JST16_17125 [Bdellovibrionales bacterium]|nr:hypothetical protein [Bdellovibrionales bacterium]
MKTNFDVRLIHRTLWIIPAGALIAATLRWLHDDFTLQIIGARVGELNLDLGLRFDTLSTILWVMVSCLAAVIGQYSLRYLGGEKRQSYFYRNLLLTTTFVGLLILSSNLLMLFVAWIGTSYGLHKLLTYFPDRPGAIAAARKKFIISRLGDLAILFGIGLTYRAFGTLDFSSLFEAAKQVTAHTPQAEQLSTIGFLFVLGAMTKSAQFPFHFWLPETMETPTPVSALMHAGIINAGGFLIIRLSPLLQHATAANALLIAVGALTAVFGALVMVTQTDIKRKLAYSTISQMGMMMLACGLGAYSVALFHIVAHSFYKAHAFLSTGFLVEKAKKIGFKTTPPSNTLLWLTGFIGLNLIAWGPYPAYFTYAAILLLGVVQNSSWQNHVRYSTGSVHGIIATILIAAVSIFALIEFGLHGALSGASTEALTPLRRAASFLAFGLFFGGFWINSQLVRTKERLSPFYQKLYMWLWNGGHFSIRSDLALRK